MGRHQKCHIKQPGVTWKFRQRQLRGFSSTLKLFAQQQIPHLQSSGARI
jgi:hypothetical protein